MSRLCQEIEVAREIVRPEIMGARGIPMDSALPWKVKADMPLRLTPEIINAAIDGFAAQKTRLDARIAELRAMLPGGHDETAATPVAPKPKRRKMSAAARKRIGDAQRKRWAESKQTAAPVGAPKTKRKLSAAGRANIVAALKKRWASKKAAAKLPSPVAKKKMSSARKAALVANLAKARAARAAKREAAR